MATISGIKAKYPDACVVWVCLEGSYDCLLKLMKAYT